MINFILENFDTIFKNKTSLETLDKVILDLAIKGKLVEQNQDDEPASELIKRIKAEKQRLIDEKIIKKEKSLPPIEEEEIPFDIPNNWEWVRLKDISYLNPRNTAEDNLITSFVPMKLIFDGYENNHLTEDKLWKDIKSGFTHFKDDDIGIAKITPCFENRKSVIFKNLKNGLGAGTTELYIIRVFGKDILNSYLLNIFKSERFITEGIKTYTGTAGQQRVKKEFVENFLIPLPPIEEQKRIVSKVEKLQSIIKDLKEIYIKNQSNRENLKKSLLSEIESQSSDKDLLKNLETVFTNFDKIIKTKEDIKDIRNLILSLAIKGKLVEQREDDEKASELLKRIKAEKQRLIDEKVIKKEKPLPPIEDEEIPFDIPNSWEWVRLGEVSKIVRGGSPRPINLYLTDASDGINWIKIGDTEKDGKYINSAKEKIKKEGIKKSRFVKKGDFLLTNSMSFGRPYILNIDGCVHDGWLIISDYQKNYDIDFLYYMLSSEFTYLQFSKNVSGSVVKNLNIEKVITSIFPLPPIEEQKRIVSKVESLMKICDLLEEKITLNEKISENLFLSFIK